MSRSSALAIARSSVSSGRRWLRGVRVRALIAHTNRGGESRLRKLEQRLLSAGVTVARSADDLRRYHGKFMVVDDTLHVFGFNFTKLDIDKSRSFGIATRDRRTVLEALKLFEADFTRPGYTSVALESGRESRKRAPALSAFIRGARHELAIYDQKIQDPTMVKLIKDRAAKGVNVRVIGDLKGPDGEVQVRKGRGSTCVRSCATGHARSSAVRASEKWSSNRAGKSGF